MASLLGLEDVEQAARERPDTFLIPPDAERRSQQVGDSVRLHFLLANPAANEPRAERMWVTIIEPLNSDGCYKGKLENQPAVLKDVTKGDEVSFEPRHIAQTVTKRGAPRWIDSAELTVIVSALCLKAEECVRFLYRQQPDRPEDSGWRMFTGHESDERGKRAQLVSVGWMLDKDPSLLEPLKGSVGAVFERKGRGSSWVAVTDWSPGE